MGEICRYCGDAIDQTIFGEWKHSNPNPNHGQTAFSCWDGQNRAVPVEPQVIPPAEWGRIH